MNIKAITKRYKSIILLALVVVVGTILIVNIYHQPTKINSNNPMAGRLESSQSSASAIEYGQVIDESERLKSEIKKREETDFEKGINKGWKTYVNLRFEYSVRYPKSWREGKVAQNNDGRALYEDETGNKVLVYGSYRPSLGTSLPEEPGERGVILLNDGREANFLKQSKEGRILYEVYFTQDGKEDNTRIATEFTLYSEVSEQFYRENENTIIDVAKSLQVLEGNALLDDRRPK